jgi:hypothetical protein
MPIPTRARTSALGGYVTGHGIVEYTGAGGGTGDAAVPGNGHCTVPCGVPDAEEVADTPPAPSAPMPSPIASPVRVSSAFGFTGAGPDLRPQMNACVMQRNPRMQYASRVCKCVYWALCMRSCFQALSRKASSVLSSCAYTPQRAHLAVKVTQPSLGDPVLYDLCHLARPYGGETKHELYDVTLERVQDRRTARARHGTEKFLYLHRDSVSLC